MPNNQMPNEDRGPKRAKFWKELTPEEKIERMREIVRQMDRRVDQLENRIASLERHDHLNGNLVAPLQNGPYCERKQNDGEECYF